ncbi:hypothetical protein KUTeg_009573 [Tegillarca granosa]|uniref:Rabaptin coiled-coil domain-containing protein n=1 Tax=Tegillarca granosa TaxID=220873 RepID=A0ABQ9F498_TEGGR|nr:hypothetical protein KUTeg_009573 [Tegillarca granosa]
MTDAEEFGQLESATSNCGSYDNNISVMDADPDTDKLCNTRLLNSQTNTKGWILDFFPHCSLFVNAFLRDNISQSRDDIISLKERIALLEKRENELMEEIKQNENDFGQKRAKFKEIYLQKEEELKKEKEAVTKAKEEVKDLKLKVENLNSELQGIKAAVELSETSKQDEIENLRRDCQQEVASLQRLMSGGYNMN